MQFSRILLLFAILVLDKNDRSFAEELLHDEPGAFLLGLVNNIDRPENDDAAKAHIIALLRHFLVSCDGTYDPDQDEHMDCEMTPLESACLLISTLFGKDVILDESRLVSWDCSRKYLRGVGASKHEIPYIQACLVCAGFQGCDFVCALFEINLLWLTATVP